MEPKDNHRFATIADFQGNETGRKGIAVHCRNVMRNAGMRPANGGLRSNGTHATNGAESEEFEPE